MSSKVDVMTLIDPEVAEALVALDLRLGELSDERLHSIRERLGAVPLPALSDAVERRDYPVPERPPVSVRVHREKNASGRLPCIYWMHGGGLILGRNVGDDPRFDRWCPRLGCVGVSVEYALAPESRYPGPLEDCYAGLKWDMLMLNNLASTSRVSALVARAPAPDWRPALLCWRAIVVKSRSRFRLSSIP